MTRDPNALLDVVGRFDGHEILVIGDFYLDRYVGCHVHGVSPEKPVLRLVEDHTDYAAGSAGHVCACFAALGARVRAFGRVGADREGKIFRALLEDAGVDTEGLAPVDPSTPLLTRYIIDDGSAQPFHNVRIDRVDPSGEDAAAGEARLADYLERHGDKLSAVFVSDYDESTPPTGLVSPGLLARVKDVCAERNLPLAGSSRRNLERFAGAAMLFANRSEVAGIAGATDFSEDLVAAARERLGAAELCVTLSEDGVVCAGKDGLVRERSYADAVVDPCGAGDSFATAYTLARLSGAELDAAAAVGSYASAASIAKDGTVPVRLSELKLAIRYRGAPPAKLRTADVLRSELAPLRNRKRVVFTNGCFDLFHAGHVEFLRQARKHGDLLVVGLNSDDSTRANKGPGRPLLSEAERAKIMSSLESVDYVVVFDDLTPVNLIRTLAPSVLVKGGNYGADDVVGKDIIDSLGGEVVVVPLQEGGTTAALIDSIKSASNGRRPQ